jgi:uncharacterized membrane protein
MQPQARSFQLKLTDELLIQAPVEFVWNVTVDVESWPRWTPTVTSVKIISKGEFGLGSRALLKQPMQAEAEWIVTKFQPLRLFEWVSRRSGIYLTARHEILQTEKGTISKLTLFAEGFLIRLLWPVLKNRIAQSIKTENLGLKKYCETANIHLSSSA